MPRCCLALPALLLLLMPACVRYGYSEAERSADHGAAPADAGRDGAASTPDAPRPDGPRPDGKSPDLGPAPDAQPAPDTSPPPDTLKPDAPPVVQAPPVSWADNPGAASADLINGVALDSTGKVFVVGVASGPTSLGGGIGLPHHGKDDVIVASYSAPGKHRWSYTIGGANIDRGYAVAIGSGNDVYICGSFADTVVFGGSSITSAGGLDIFIARFDNNGVPKWLKRWGGSGNDACRGLVVAGGAVHFAGQIGAPAVFGVAAIGGKGGSDILVASITDSGVHRWASAHGAALTDLGRGITTDAAGNVYAVGVFSSSVTFGSTGLTSKGSLDGFVASYTSAGTPRWAASMGSQGLDYAFGVAAGTHVQVVGLAAGAVTVSNTFKTLPALGKDDLLAVSFSTSGAFRWGKLLGSAASLERAYAVGVVAGSVVLAGTLAGSASFGGPLLNAGGNEDLLLLSLSEATGAHIWSTRYGGSSIDRAYGMAVSSTALVVGGVTFNDLKVGSTMLTNKGYADGLLIYH